MLLNAKRFRRARDREEKLSNRVFCQNAYNDKLSELTRENSAIPQSSQTTKCSHCLHF